MVLREKDANAQILRNFIDFSTKPNQFFLTNLHRSVPEILDDHECAGEAKSKVGVLEGIKLLRRNYRLNNIDISYILVLISRGFKFRVITERVFLCEEKAINPSFKYFTPIKPRISDSFETKTMVLDAIADCQDKENKEITQLLVNAIPELLERSYGVRYTGRFLSINQWLELKEKEGTWASEESLKLKDCAITPWMIGYLLALQARGWFLQEIPEKFKGNDYILIEN
ncbi:hypothetical protein EU534_00115 [Candidatus Heimdallarchaeota archaeon]|nr:MAG: hypothetical protein EU534_00115 [Candidatus Heimdallarchaeota archaeon]